MTRDEARAILEAHNKWRRGGYVATESPSELGRAIDVAVAELAKPAAVPTDEAIVAAFKAAGMNTDIDQMPNMLYSVRGQLAQLINGARALLADQQPAAVPDGWVMVPKVPTAEMIRANGQSGFDVGDKWLAEDAKRTWASMLAAAPQPPAPPVDVEAVRGTIFRMKDNHKLRESRCKPDPLISIWANELARAIGETP